MGVSLSSDTGPTVDQLVEQTSMDHHRVSALTLCFLPGHMLMCSWKTLKPHGNIIIIIYVQLFNKNFLLWINKYVLF